MERSNTLSHQPVSEDMLKTFDLHMGISLPLKKPVHIQFMLKSLALQFCFHIWNICICHFNSKAALKANSLYEKNTKYSLLPVL